MNNSLYTTIPEKVVETPMLPYEQEEDYALTFYDPIAQNIEPIDPRPEWMVADNVAKLLCEEDICANRDTLHGEYMLNFNKNYLKTIVHVLTLNKINYTLHENNYTDIRGRPNQKRNICLKCDFRAFEQVLLEGGLQ